MAKVQYHILRTFQTGAIVKDGVEKVRQYEYICRHPDKPVRMENKINKDGDTVEVYAECPKCGIRILEGFYEI